MEFKFSSKITFNRRAKIIWAVLVCVVVFLLLWVWINTPSFPASAAVAVPAPSTKPFPPVKKDIPASDSGAAAVDPASVFVSSYKLGDISELRGELAVRKLQTEISDQIAKQEALKGKAAVPVTAAPAQVLRLPDLTPPAAGSRLPVLPPARTGSASGMGVVSVQGVGNSISATIRTGSNIVNVRPGSKIGDGVVTSITREAVSVRRNGKISAIPFD